MSEKALVTGGGGFLGCYVVRELLERGADVTVYDSFVQYAYPMSAEHFQNATRRLDGIEDRVEIIRSSTEFYDYLRTALHRVQPDVIIHLAAMPLANMAREHPEEAVLSIVNGTLNLLRAARDLDGLDRLVYVSSSMVYGNFQSVPVGEDHPTDPRDIYGALKLAGETLVRAFGTTYGIDYAIVRPSAVYGPMDNNRRVLAHFVSDALDGKPLTVNGAATMLDFTFASDTARGIVAAALHPGGSGQTFNVTRGEGRTLQEAAAIVAELIPGTKVDLHEPEAWRPVRGTLDISRARRLIDYEPRVSLENGLARYVAYVAEQRRAALGTS